MIPKKYEGSAVRKVKSKGHQHFLACLIHMAALGPAALSPNRQT